MQLRALPLLLFISFINLTQPAAAQQPPAGQHAGATLAVIGVGHVEVRPDHARFSATVSTGGSTLTEASKAHDERAREALSLLQGLKDAGMDITQASFWLDRETPSADRRLAEKPPEPPFIAVTDFYLTARPIEALNGIVTKLASSGLFKVGRVTFLADQERKVLNDARREAVRDAHELMPMPPACDWGRSPKLRMAP
jgi:uncharacterized protein